MPTAEEDIAYYRRRIDVCSEQARRAEYVSARRAHEALARLYREKLAALGVDLAASDERDVVELGAVREAADKASSRSTPDEL